MPRSKAARPASKKADAMKSERTKPNGRDKAGAEIAQGKPPAPPAACGPHLVSDKVVGQLTASQLAILSGHRSRILNLEVAHSRAVRAAEQARRALEAAEAELRQRGERMLRAMGIDVDGGDFSINPATGEIEQAAGPVTLLG